MMNKYLQERGDANIKTNADLISKARFYEDPNFPDRKQGKASRGTRHGAGHIGTAADPLRPSNPVAAVHAGTAARRASLPYVHCPATKAHGAARTEREWPLSDWLVAHRAARFPRDHRACGLYDGDLGSRAAMAMAARAWSAPSRPTCRSASTSLRVRLTKQCYSASPRLSKQQPGIDSRRRTSDRCLMNRSFSPALYATALRLPIRMCWFSA